jgi:FemAB-related protein (PEP-CTERM system-associated)
MHIRQAKDSDMELWDRYVTQHPDASPYHQYAWRKSIEKAYGMSALYLLALGDNDQVIGVLPSILINVPFSSQYLCSLPYCDRGEAIVDSNEVEEGLIRELINQAKAHNINKISYRATDKLTTSNIPSEEELIGQKVRMLLNLPESADALLKGFKAKLRSQINKAKKNGLEVSVGNNDHNLESFYQVFTQNMRDLGSPTHSKKWFQSITDNYADNCVLSVVYYQGTPIGGGIILINGSTVAIPWASTLRSYNRLAPNMLLYWSLLSYATDLGCKQFDFGRSTYGEGTYKFKRQWGAKPQPLVWKEIEIDSGQSTTLQSSLNESKTRKLLENIWQRVPLFITVWIGSGIRKYISL